MPAEVHEHFNDVGNRTGHTVVYRESPWDDASRASATEFVRWEQSIDPTTRLPAEVAFTPGRFVVEDHTNYAEVSLARRRRKDEADAKKLNGGALPEGWNDGVTYSVRPATAAELEAAQPAQEGGDDVGD